LKLKYPIKLLCQLLKCSRSGYYDWIGLGRPAYKSYKEELSNLILKQYLSDTRQGIVQLRMGIKAINSISLTNKTVYRYMRLLDIRSITGRKPKKYNKIPHHEIPNLLKRDFTTTGPNQKWSIDITYIHTSEGVEYLCVIKDLYDKSIITYRQSRFNDNPLVLQTVKEAFTKIPLTQRINLILHSDQGSQFTSIDYRKLLKRRQVRHSVSYQGSCADNVPIESWFSLLKCESLKLHRLTSRNIAKQLVSDYVIFYNYSRLQEQLKELTPIMYRKSALT
jgi:putative transposase